MREDGSCRSITQQKELINREKEKEKKKKGKEKLLVGTNPEILNGIVLAATGVPWHPTGTQYCDYHSMKGNTKNVE